MSYSRVNWQDSPSTASPIDATNLNVMDAGIATLDTTTPKIGAGNAQVTPAFTFIVVGPDSSHLPSAGVKGRIAFVVNFSPS